MDAIDVLSVRSPSAEADRVYKAMEPELRSMVSDWVNAQGEITDYDLNSLTARLRATAQPTRNLLDEQVGPFYDTTGLRSWVGTSRQAISGRVQRKSLVACQLEDATWVYPTWQFNDDGTVKAPVIAVWQVLRGPPDHPGADPWTCALWMRAANPDLDSKTPVEWIDDGETVEDVVILARQAATRWAR